MSDTKNLKKKPETEYKMSYRLLWKIMITEVKNY